MQSPPLFTLLFSALPVPLLGRRQALFGALLAGALLVGCSGELPTGLMETPQGNGPRVVWNLQEKPLPNIPFPNDYALRLDDTAPTGRRLNISQEAPTEIESRFRRRAMQLDGFGTYSPITVSFEAPLDIANIIERQRGNDSWSDDVAIVIDITPDSPTYGQPVALDFGQGHHPATVLKPNHYFPQDPHVGQASLLFEARNEDTNGNGRLDPGEDIDADGILDQSNVESEEDNPWDALLTFYDRETETLRLRPLRPLRQATRYAVVLTDGLLGTDGEPIRSPFPYVTLAAQGPDLAVLPELLEAQGISHERIAFAWSFTTQSITRDLLNIRAGLYGHGPFAWLSAQFPPTYELTKAHPPEGPGRVHVITSEELIPFTALLSASFGLSTEMQDMLTDSFSHISHVVFGTYPAPNFLVDRDGHAVPGAPADDDEAFELDESTGQAVVGTTQVSFLCAIPKPRGGLKQPFPVTLQTPGTGVPKLMALGFAGFHAEQGLASCSIDPWGHGMDIPPTGEFSEALLEGILGGLGFTNDMIGALEGTRIRDLDNDGLGDSAGDFWNPDTFHTRDTLRQTVVDWYQFVRLLRGFDGVRLAAEDIDGDGSPNAQGDFDADGVPDIGTEDGIYTAWGISLGGIVTAVLAAAEPKLSAAVPNSGGGGLVDVAMRSLQTGVPEAVLLGNWGPLVMGRPLQGDETKTQITFMIPNFFRVRYAHFATVDALSPGDVISFQNLRTLELSHARVNAKGGFRCGVPADAMIPSEMRAIYGLVPGEPQMAVDTLALGDPLRVCISAEDGTMKGCIDSFERDVEWAGMIYPVDAPLVAMTPGLGRNRNTDDFRRLAGIAQAVTDPADPVNWARYYHEEKLEFPYDPGVESGCNVLDLLTVGDPQVPVAAGITLARAAGIVDEDDMKRLIEHGVVEGNWRLARYRTDGSGPHPYDPDFKYNGADGDTSILYDIDDLDNGADGMNAPSPETPLRATVSTPNGGKAGLRILYIKEHGSHGLLPPDPGAAFSIGTYGINMVTRYLVTGGKDLVDDPCLEDGSCAFFNN